VRRSLGPGPMRSAEDAAGVVGTRRVWVLDDTYNANADSVIAALQTLRELPCKGRRMAVLGDMAELGAHGEAAHEEIGRRAAELGVGQLLPSGKWRRSWRAARGTPG